MARQPEAKIVRKIQDHFMEKGARAFKIHGSDEGFQEVGIPDLLVCYRGRFIGAEVKQSGEKLRPRQRHVLREIYDAGGVAAVLETVGQAARLLSYLDQEVVREEAHGVCFDRGVVVFGGCKFY